jgi:prepilin-type processing-associated H-X9-DG protein
LIEVFVVIVIIGVLTALVFTAVQGARGAARAATCRNNLRQIGIALHAYSEVIGHFPPGMYGRGYSVHAMLLPYLDQRSLYESINFDLDFRSIHGDGGNTTAAATRLAVFLCPSDRGSIFGTAETNYPGNRGSGVQTYGYNGAFARELDGMIDYGDFRDGTSQTAAFSEWVLGPERQMTVDFRRSTFETHRAWVGPAELDRFAAECRKVASAEGAVTLLRKGESWLRADLSFTLYTHVLEINGPTCTNGGLVQEGAWTAGSYHPGGAHVLFVDGHCSFLSDTLDLSLWRAMGSRNGGEMIETR